MWNVMIFLATFLRWSSSTQHTALMSAEKGGRLEGYTFRFIEVPSSSECGQHCLADRRCQSINYGSGVSKFDLIACELNNSTKDEKPDSLTVDMRFTYYEPIKQTPTKHNNLTAPGPQSSTTSNPLETSQNASNLHKCSSYLPYRVASGSYTIYDQVNNKSLLVYCHFDHTLNEAWTLVLSFSFANHPYMDADPFWMNVPINTTTPNFLLYRMSLIEMKHIQNQSTQWRAVCNYSQSMSDQRDSVRGRFTELNPLDKKVTRSCKRVEYVNIRGHVCINCTVLWFQETTQFLHIDSGRDRNCTFNGRQDAVTSEDNFGHYIYANPNFGCTKYENSTTSWWFR